MRPLSRLAPLALPRSRPREGYFWAAGAEAGLHESMLQRHLPSLAFLQMVTYRPSMVVVRPSAEGTVIAFIPVV